MNKVRADDPQFNSFADFRGDIVELIMEEQDDSGDDEADVSHNASLPKLV